VSPGPDRPGRPDGAPTLDVVVLGDSTAFTDDRGPQLPDHPDLYPNVLARELGARIGRSVRVTVVARPGADVRETLRTVLKDRHVQFDLIGPADAVVVAVGSLDHAPRGVPPVLDALVPHLRPARARRLVRRALLAANPIVVRATGGRRRRTPPREFARQYGLLLDQVRGLTLGRAPIVALGPTSHRASHHGGIHPLRAVAEAHQTTLATDRGIPVVATWPLVEPFAHRLNPDGIHWPAPVHDAVGTALADALLAQLDAGAAARRAAPH
jgi:diglucosylglycerate octanoyltransferase